MLDKSIALNKLRSKNKFSINFHCEQWVSSKRSDKLLTCKAVRYDSRCNILAPPDSMLLHNIFLLTLSQLEPQINLKSNLLIFVISIFGIISGNIDALYIIRGIIKLFTIVILPIKVRLREDHKLKIFFILFNKGTKFNSSSFFALS